MRWTWWWGGWWWVWWWRCGAAASRSINTFIDITSCSRSELCLNEYKFTKWRRRRSKERKRISLNSWDTSSFSYSSLQSSWFELVCVMNPRVAGVSLSKTLNPCSSGAEEAELVFSLPQCGAEGNCRNQYTIAVSLWEICECEQESEWNLIQDQSSGLTWKRIMCFTSPVGSWRQKPPSDDWRQRESLMKLLSIIKEKQLGLCSSFSSVRRSSPSGCISLKHTGTTLSGYSQKHVRRDGLHHPNISHSSSEHSLVLSEESNQSRFWMCDCR